MKRIGGSTFTRLWMGEMGKFLRPIVTAATVAICAFVFGLMLFVIFDKISNAQGGELIPASEQSQEAPYEDLSMYQFWAAGDSAYLCNPKGCAALPDGSIILTPLPRQVRQPSVY